MMYSIDSLGVKRGWLEEAATVKGKTVEMMIPFSDMPYSERFAKSVAIAGTFVKEDFSDNREIIAEVVAHDVAGSGPFSMLMDSSKNIEEIVVNSPRSNVALYHSRYGYCTTNLRFIGEKDLRYTVNKLIAGANRELNSANPVVDTHIDNGSRIHAQTYPCTASGCTVSVRLKNGWRFDVRRLIKCGSASPETFAYIWMALDSDQNMIISGAPASGKTTILLAMCAMIPRYRRIITIEEDMAELELHPGFMNVVPLKGSILSGKVSVKDQIINALHLRPDRILVGEVRGDETKEVFFGSNLGVPFMTTMHSSSDGMGVIGRLQAKPMSVEPALMQMLDLSLFMRQGEKSRRIVDSITEYHWLSRTETSIDNDLGEMKLLPVVSDGVLNNRALQKSKVIARFAASRIVTRDAAIKELGKRAAFLKEVAAKPESESIINCFDGYGGAGGS
jgi:type IV secretory pathway ATPase VirB11/archaellum biosynthesis ATPase